MAKHSWAVILIILLSSLVYLNMLGNSFVWDDYLVIVDNDFIKSWANLPRLFSKSYITMLTDLQYLGLQDIGSGESYYRPMVTLSYFIDYSLWKLNAFGYHLTNLVLHIFNALLFYFFIGYIGKNKKVALWASLLFALHPVNTEVVANISFREDLLAFLFMLSSFLLFVKLDLYKAGKRFFCYSMSLFLFLIALLSKEMAMSLPFLLMAYDYIFTSRGKLRDLATRFRTTYIGYIGVLPFYIYLRFFLITSDLDFAAKYLGGGFYTNILSMFRVVAYYIKWLFLPTDVRIIWPIGPKDLPFVSHSLFTPGTIGSILLIAACLVAAVKMLKRSKEASFGISWFFIALIPVSNLFPLVNFIACRFLYIPVAGFSLLISSLAFRLSALKSRSISPNILRGAARGVIIALLVFYGAFTVIRNYHWKNNMVFWTEVSENYPDEYKLRLNVARDHLNKGDIDKALEVYNWVIDIDPECARAYEGRGLCYKERGLAEEAIKNLRKAVELRPELLTAYIELGSALAKEGLYEEAEKAFRHAIENDSNCLAAYVGLGNIFTDKGLYADAIEFFRRAIKIDPRNVSAYNNLGFTYVVMGNRSEAKKMWERALEIDPEDEIAQNNLKVLQQSEER